MSKGKEREDVGIPKAGEYRIKERKVSRNNDSKMIMMVEWERDGLKVERERETEVWICILVSVSLFYFHYPSH